MIAPVLLAALLQPLGGVHPVRTWEVLGSDRHGGLGRTVRFLGDVDGDGLADIVSHVDYAESSMPRPPGAGVVRGLSGADGHQLYEVWGESDYANLGSQLVALDDLDGDGAPDFAASTKDLVELRSGRDGALIRRIDPRWPQPINFWQLSAIDDLDADGHRDLLVAVGEEIRSGFCGTGHVEDPGRLLVWSTRDGAVLRAVEAPDAREHRFGLRATTIADRDGDGVRELAIDLPWELSCRIYSGATGLLQATLREDDRTLGGSLLDVGDADGDGASDLVLAAEHEPARGGPAWTGLHLVSGRSLERLKERSLDEWPDTCLLLPDADGDGVRELVIGQSSAAGYRGRVQILAGKDLRVLASIAGPTGSGLFGNSFDVIGELGGGQGPALVVGAVGDDRGVEGGGSITLLRLR